MLTERTPVRFGADRDALTRGCVRVPGSGTVVPRCGRLAQRESASFTPKRSLVRSQYRPRGQRAYPATGYALFAVLRDQLSDSATGSRAASTGDDRGRP